MFSEKIHLCRRRLKARGTNSERSAPVPKQAGSEAGRQIPAPPVCSARNSGVTASHQGRCRWQISSLGLHHSPPAEQAHSGSFGKGRTPKTKL